MRYAHQRSHRQLQARGKRAPCEEVENAGRPLTAPAQPCSRPLQRAFVLALRLRALSHAKGLARWLSAVALGL